MKTLHSSETLVVIDQSTWSNITEDHNLQQRNSNLALFLFCSIFFRTHEEQQSPVLAGVCFTGTSLRNLPSGKEETLCE